MLLPVKEKFESLTKKHEKLMQRLSSLSPEVLSFKVGPDRWSVVEVVEHLVIAEKNLLQQLSTHIPSSSLDPKSKTPDHYQMVINVMEQDIEVDVPDNRAEPQGRVGLDELRRQWDAIRDQLPTYLSEITMENRDELVYQHPFGGPLNISETLHFIDVHYDNHMRHIDRILAEVK